MLELNLFKEHIEKLASKDWDKLFDLIPKIENAKSFGKWITNQELEPSVIQMPFVKYEAIVTGPNNETYSGTLWEAKEKLPLPLKWHDPANNLEVTWENVTVLGFSRNIFELPEGYVKVEMQFLCQGGG